MGGNLGKTETDTSDRVRGNLLPDQKNTRERLTSPLFFLGRPGIGRHPRHALALLTQLCYEMLDDNNVPYY